MKVEIDLQVGILARTYADAEFCAFVWRIPDQAWFHATPDQLLGRRNAIFFAWEDWEERDDAAEIARLRSGCEIVFRSDCLKALRDQECRPAPPAPREILEIKGAIGLSLWQRVVARWASRGPR